MPAVIAEYQPALWQLPGRVAEREGFEPSLEFPLNTLSKRAPSTTRPSLLTLERARSVAVLSLAQAEQVVTNSQIPFGIGRQRRGASAQQVLHVFLRRRMGF